MPTTNTPVKNTKGITPLLAVLYTVFSCVSIFVSVSGISTSTLLLSLLSGFPSMLVVMFFYYGFLMSLGENSNKGAYLIIIPTLFALFAGYIFSNAEITLSALLDFVSASVTAAVIAYCSNKKESRAFACSAAAFTMFVFSILGSFISLLILSVSNSISIGTLLFDGISDFIDAYIAIYNDAAATISSMYTGTDNPVMFASTEYLTRQLTSIIALSPALMYSFLFFASFIFTYIADALCKKIGITEEYSFKQYRVSSLTNLIFTIVGIITMLSILFEENMSAFTCGILSVLIILLPHYIILGIRRIFTLLKNRFSKGASVTLLLVIGAFGISLSPALLVLVVLFFGTTEYRTSKNTL